VKPSVHSRNLLERAAIHAVLGEPTRLAIIEDLVVSDRSPLEISGRFDISSNLLAHHLDALESVGLIQRTTSAGDGRRKYVQVVPDACAGLALNVNTPPREMLFLCTRNSARSQLAAALWTARTGLPAKSAGTHPSECVHRGALSAARRVGLSLENAVPKTISRLPKHVQVVTVCDMVHEELKPSKNWWHWSIPDPVSSGDAATFDVVVNELESRIHTVNQTIQRKQGNEK
jgi:ArsR family transcriptional regulator, arsenate/arsenite/antimonite-responsive transcriptional repressor / arsenate reductase (thioredoxin)